MTTHTYTSRATGEPRTLPVSARYETGTGNYVAVHPDGTGHLHNADGQCITSLSAESVAWGIANNWTRS